jgi:S-formylglutathione hydrolase FrmB/lysophospholipase L1-like esterase
MAFLIVLVHEADKVASWLEDLGRKGDSYPFLLILNWGADLKIEAQKLGLVALKDKEVSFFEAITPRGTFGSVGNLTPTSPPVPANANVPPPVPQTNNNVPPVPQTNINVPPGPQTSINVPPGPNLESNELPATIPQAAPGVPTTIPLNIPAPESDSEVLIYEIKSSPQYKNILLLGDSFMVEGLGPVLEHELNRIPELTVNREFKSATGLCRPDFFDWFTFFKEQLELRKPELVIISIGANDTQDIVTEDRVRYHVTSEGWNEEYGTRVQRILDMAADANVMVFWLGLPIMGKKPYNERVLNINQVVEKTCSETLNCRFFDSWSLLADENGNFTNYMTGPDGKHVRIRAKDSIHLTEKGATIIVNAFLSYAGTWGIYGVGGPNLPITQVATLQGEAPLEDTTVAENAEPGPEEDTPSETQVSVEETSAEESSIPFSLTLPSAELPLRTPATLMEVNLPSRARGRETSYLMYLPGPETPRPTIILLHGTQESYLVWKDRFGRQLFDLANELDINLVMPDGDLYGWYLDSPIKKNSRLEQYIMHELMGDLLTRFSLDKSRMGILGISMGGHGALTLSLKYPSTFKALSSISGLTDLALHSQDSLGENLHLEEVLGPYSTHSLDYLKNSAYHLTRQNPQALSQSSIILEVGLSDPVTLAENRQYHRLLGELGLQHEYLESRGGFSWDLWQNKVPEHIAILAQKLK